MIYSLQVYHSSPLFLTPAVTYSGFVRLSFWKLTKTYSCRNRPASRAARWFPLTERQVVPPAASLEAAVIKQHGHSNPPPSPHTQHTKNEGHLFAQLLLHKNKQKLAEGKPRRRIRCLCRRRLCGQCRHDKTPYKGRHPQARISWCWNIKPLRPVRPAACEAKMEERLKLWYCLGKGAVSVYA